MAKIKYYWFLFRWFLIGRNFCDLPKWADKCWWVVHKCFWSFTIFSIGATAHNCLKLLLLG